VGFVSEFIVVSLLMPFATVGGGEERIDPGSGVRERRDGTKVAFRAWGFWDEGGGVIEDVAGATIVDVLGEAGRENLCLTGASTSGFWGVDGSPGVETSSKDA
jgi:hypothetical protein